MPDRAVRAPHAPRRGLARRGFLAIPGAWLAVPIAHAAGGYEAFLQDLRSDALASGVSRRAVDLALRLEAPNAHVLDLDRHQPEFSLTWTEYEARVLPAGRLRQAAQARRQRAALFAEVEQRYRVDPGVIIGIWGIESDFGRLQGGFSVFDCLATLAYGSHRHRFFRGELLNALMIVDRHGIEPPEMRGSWAGAMGQPQFMPSAYLRFAQALDGGERADIWQNEADVFASVANYLARSGWRDGEPWGQRVTLSRPLAASEAGRDRPQSLAAWQSLGVRRIDGRDFSRRDVEGAMLLPDGPSGDAFLVYRNFEAIRRYNPSDFYALAVGLLSDEVA